MASARDDVVYMAKLCEQAERYDEMVGKMGDIAKMDVRGPFQIASTSLLAALSQTPQAHMQAARLNCPQRNAVRCRPNTFTTSLPLSHAGRADRRGAEPALRCVQERHRHPPRVLAHRLLHRAEGREQGQCQAGRDDPGAMHT